MKLFVLLTSFMTVKAYVIQGDIAIIDGVHHQKEILYDNLNSASKLVVDHITNNVFFYADSRLTRLNLNNSETKHFKQRGAQCIAIDHDTHDVYIGTASAIYKYRKGTEEEEMAGASGTDVWRMYFKKVLYYNKYSTGNIYMFVNSYSNMFLTLNGQLTSLLVDNDDTMYYSYDNQKLYNRKKSVQTLLYEGFVTALAADKNGKVYFCADDGIYTSVQNSIKRVIPNPCYYGLGFDIENNIVYSDHYRVIRLKPIIEQQTSTQTTKVSNNDDSKVVNATLYENINYIKTQLKSLNEKFDRLQSADTLSPSRAIRLDRIEGMNITFSIGEQSVGLSP